MVAPRSPGSQGASTSTDALRDECAERLSGDKNPDTVVGRHRAAACNINGKMMKRQLREALAP